MNIPKYKPDRKAIFCKAKTHQQVRVLAALNNISAVEFLESLVDVVYKQTMKKEVK